ncbi:hypothetical protein [Umezawaea tangerina]|uniref:Uncharacterized protein n=1 Tax=Umezawaea tangerina TaxID=84725 RepID=A0A2T0TLC3_9PSEU|nr:hypothetical protein [Umezawaea tangerina]PRY46411.1 hypothetical protein CLV43_101687 [Umezawaea tangerina]
MTGVGRGKAVAGSGRTGIALAVLLVVGAGCAGPPTAVSGPGASTSATAESVPLDVDLLPAPGSSLSDKGVLSGHGSLSVIVTVTNTGTSTTTKPLEVVLSVPTDHLRLRHRDDGEWACAADDGGMRCTIPDVVDPEESWPGLLVDFDEDTTVQDTLVVTARGAGTGEADVDFSIDTSL